MNIKVFKSYMRACESIGVRPTWEGLNRFKNKFEEEKSE